MTDVATARDKTIDSFKNLISILEDYTSLSEGTTQAYYAEKTSISTEDLSAVAEAELVTGTFLGMEHYEFFAKMEGVMNAMEGQRRAASLLLVQGLKDFVRQLKDARDEANEKGETSE